MENTNLLENKYRILILCTGNSCRSQMAEGFLKSFDSSLVVASAGTNPAKNVHPNAIRVMADLGVDLSENYPKSVDQFLNQEFDYVISVCGGAKESCPTFTGSVKHRMHIGFEDPDELKGSPEKILQEFKRIRDEILRDFFRFYQLNLKE